VRERGIEMCGRSLSWSRVVVKEWYPREAGFDLCLSIPSRRLFTMPSARATEILVPVPATERPALEVFLAAHTPTAGKRLW